MRSAPSGLLPSRISASEVVRALLTSDSVPNGPPVVRRRRLSGPGGTSWTNHQPPWSERGSLGQLPLSLLPVSGSRQPHRLNIWSTGGSLWKPTPAPTRVVRWAATANTERAAEMIIAGAIADGIVAILGRHLAASADMHNHIERVPCGNFMRLLEHPCCVRTPAANHGSPPTSVGSTSTRSTRRCVLADHPRGRGEHCSRVRRSDRFDGSPPRAWGARRRRHPQAVAAS